MVELADRQLSGIKRAMKALAVDGAFGFEGNPSAGDGWNGKKALAFFTFINDRFAIGLSS